MAVREAQEGREVKYLQHLRRGRSECREVCYVLGPTILVCNLLNGHDEGPNPTQHHDLVRDKKWLLPKVN